MKDDSINVTQNFECRCFKSGLANTFTKGVWVIAVHAGRAHIAAFELIYDEGG